MLANGKIIFTRWEHHTDDNQLDLYTVNPDGSDLQLLYGAHSHATGDVPPGETTPSIIQFLGPRAMQDGRTLALVRPDEGTNEGGDLILIDTANFVDNTQPLAANAGLAGPAQTRALPTDVRTIPGPSPGRTVSFRSAAVRRQQSPARQLVAVSPARSRTHRSVHERSPECDRAAAGRSAAALRRIRL